MTITITISTKGPEFPDAFWGANVRADLHFPRFFESEEWKKMKDPDKIGLEPPPGPDQTHQEIKRLLDMQADVEERERRRPEILREADGEFPYFHRVMLFSAASRPFTLTLANGMVRLAGVVVMHYKHLFKRARPSQLEPELRPMIDVPPHASYPSGHATQMYLVAEALAAIGRNHGVGEELFKIAERIAVNREWAGVHYPSDSAAGARLAQQIFPVAQIAYEDVFVRAAREWL